MEGLDCLFVESLLSFVVCARLYFLGFDGMVYFSDFNSPRMGICHWIVDCMDLFLREGKPNGLVDGVVGY